MKYGGPRFQNYPVAAQTRSGMKVSWLYYESLEDAEAASKAARSNAVIQEAAGYDFGYQSPGQITGPRDNGFYPGLYEVCIP